MSTESTLVADRYRLLEMLHVGADGYRLARVG